MTKNDTLSAVRTIKSDLAGVSKGAGPVVDVGV